MRYFAPFCTNDTWGCRSGIRCFSNIGYCILIHSLKVGTVGLHGFTKFALEGSGIARVKVESGESEGVERHFGTINHVILLLGVSVTVVATLTVV